MCERTTKHLLLSDCENDDFLNREFWKIYKSDIKNKQLFCLNEKEAGNILKYLKNNHAKNYHNGFSLYCVKRE